MGKVYLIGAGPSNEELITLKAVRVLKKCTAVLYDRLAGEHILNYVSDNCKIYYCGKESGSHYKTQEQINKMLINLVRDGHIVGRIKGGDPFVFGRGGEEGEILYSNQIEYEVIPGITSVISVLSYAGIPITNRGYSKSFHVFTGKSAGGLDFDWNIIGKLSGTLVFLMGLNKLEYIINNLKINKKNIYTPCAVIMKGTTSKQKTIIGTLEDIVIKVMKANLQAPCIIVIGEVVKLSNILNWYEKKALFGLNVCVTRSKEQSISLKEKLLDLGAEVTQLNAIKIKPIKDQLNIYFKKLELYEYIVFTSINSVNIFFNILIDNKIDIRNIKGKIAVIGTSTKKALEKYGIFADIISEQFVGENFANQLVSIVKKNEKVLIPASKHSRNIVSDTLKKAGAIVDVVHTYEAVPEQIKNLKSFEQVDIVIYTSPSIVKNMIKMVGIDNMKIKKALAIGPITAKELLKNGIECIVADEHCEDGIINKLLNITL